MNILKIIIVAIVLLSILSISLIYLFQEKLMFFPQKLNQEYQYRFDQKFEELMIKTSDNKFINALLFKADNSKGVIFYLHGNAGSLESWGTVAQLYTVLNYDVFIFRLQRFWKE